MNSNVCYTCIMYWCCLYIYIYICVGDIFHIHMRTLDSPSIHPKGFSGVHIINIHTYSYILILIHYIHTWIHRMVVGVKYVLFSSIFFGVETSSLIMCPWSPWTLQVISCWVGAWGSLGRRSIRSCRNPLVLWTAVGWLEILATGISTEFHGHLNGETMMKNHEEQ